MKGPAAHCARALAQRVLILLAVFATATGTGLAQTDTGRTSSQPAGDGVEFSASVIEAYDGDVPREVAALGASLAESRGYSTMFLGDLHYAHVGPRIEVGLDVNSALRYYQELGATRSINHTAGFGLSSRLGQRTVLSVNQTAAYSPSYLYSLFPSVDPVSLGDAPAAAPDYETDDTVSYVFGTTATLSRNLSRRASLAGSAALDYTDFQQTALRRDTTAYTLNGTYSHSVERNTSISVSYRFRTGDLVYGTSEVANLPTPEWQKVTEQGVDFGISHNRLLSPTRRAFINVNLGSSRLDALESRAGDEGLGMRFSGQAEVGYQFTRTWELRGAYRRGVEFVPDLAEPAFLDGVTASIAGGLSSKVSLSGLVSYSNGESAFTGSRYLFDTYTGTVRLNWGLNDLMTIHGQYLYYFYDFGRGALLTPGVPSKAERTGARVGVTVYLPPTRG